MTKREEYGLEYIGGYTCFKLSKKLRNSKHCSENRTQMALSFLRSTKSTNEKEECNVMINEINRGSLWCINPTCKKIFEITENFFQNISCQSTISKSINIALIVDKSITSPEVQSSLIEIIESADVEVEKDVADDTVLNMIELYVRVRCFSKVKNILEKRKQHGKNSKTKGLRKNLKKISEKNTI